MEDLTTEQLDEASLDAPFSLHVGVAAANWIRDRKPDEVLPVLFLGLQDTDDFVRGLAARALGDMGEQARTAVPALGRLIDDPDITVRKCAIGALADIGAPEAIPALLSVIRDDEMAHVAETALLKIGPKCQDELSRFIDAMEDPHEQVRDAALRVVASFGPWVRGVEPILNGLLRSAKGSMRASIASAIWKITARTDVLSILEELLSHDDQDVVAHACACLAEMGVVAVPAAPRLRTLLTRVGWIGTSAARALWSIEPDAAEVLPVLATGLEHEDPMVRMQAMLGLGDMGEAARPVVPDLLRLRESDLSVNKTAATEALKKIAPEEIVDAYPPLATPSATSSAGTSMLAYFFEESVALWTEAIERNPNDGQAFNRRGCAYLNMEDYDRALADLSEAIRLDHRDSHSYLHRGTTHRLRAENDLAIADCSKSLEIDPQEADAYTNRGMARREVGDLDGAIADMTEALRLDPDAFEAHINRGLAYQDKGAFELALEDYHATLSINPLSWAASKDMAWVLACCPRADLRDGEKAKEQARNACKLTAWKEAECLDTLSTAYAELGDFATAIHWAEEAMKLGDLQPERSAEYRAHLHSYEQNRPWRILAK